MLSDNTIDMLAIIEERNYLIKKKLFEIIKISGEVEQLLEKIANENFYGDEYDN
jgi:hypothetical protein